jgi:hypothetical protein
MSFSEPPHLRHQRYMLETGQWRVQSVVSGQHSTNVGDTGGLTEPERLHARVDAALRALTEAGWPGTQAIKADVPRGYRWLPRRQRVYGQGYDLGEQAVSGDESNGRDSLALMVKDGTPKFRFRRRARPSHGSRGHVRRAVGADARDVGAGPGAVAAHQAQEVAGRRASAAPD